MCPLSILLTYFPFFIHTNYHPIILNKVIHFIYLVLTMTRKAAKVKLFITVPHHLCGDWIYNCGRICLTVPCDLVMMCLNMQVNFREMPLDEAFRFTTVLTKFYPRTPGLGKSLIQCLCTPWGSWSLPSLGSTWLGTSWMPIFTT